MTAEFSGKVAFITGGTSGIGRATALAFARHGAHVVLTGRREPEGRAVAQDVERLGVKGLFVRADASKDAELRHAIEQAMSLTGRIDAAFNNAGVEGSVMAPTAEQTEENYSFIFDINVKGVFLSMKHEIRAMLSPRSGKPGGVIVNNASIAGSIGFPGAGLYTASKHAVIGLTRTAALEYSKQGIRVNTVSPAAIQTDMFDRFTGTDEAKKGLASMHPIGRVGTSDEIADAVLWLSSPRSSFVTGHDLLVDGGFTAQ